MNRPYRSSSGTFRTSPVSPLSETPFFHYSLGARTGRTTPILAAIPSEHDHAVHDVPRVAEVGAGMQQQAECDHFERRLDAEYRQEVRLGSVLHAQSHFTRATTC